MCHFRYFRSSALHVDAPKPSTCSPMSLRASHVHFKACWTTVSISVYLACFPMSSLYVGIRCIYCTIRRISINTTYTLKITSLLSSHEASTSSQQSASQHALHEMSAGQRQIRNLKGTSQCPLQLGMWLLPYCRFTSLTVITAITVKWRLKLVTQ